MILQKHQPIPTLVTHQGVFGALNINSNGIVRYSYPRYPMRVVTAAIDVKIESMWGILRWES